METKTNEENPLVDFGQIKATLQDKKKRGEIIRTLLFYVAIYALFLLLTSQFDISAETVQAQFAGFGAFLVPAFIALQLLASLTPLPDLPFIITGILFFEAWAAFLLIWFGMWLGTVTNFLFARYFGREFIKRRYPQTVDWLDRFTSKYWFETVVVGRSFGLVTFDIVAYAAGISNLKFYKFAFASVFGIIPVALNALLLGLALTAGDLGRTVIYGLLTGSLALGIGFGSRFFSRQWGNRETKEPLLPVPDGIPDTEEEKAMIAAATKPPTQQ